MDNLSAETDDAARGRCSGLGLCKSGEGGRSGEWLRKGSSSGLLRGDEKKAGVEGPADDKASTLGFFLTMFDSFLPVVEAALVAVATTSVLVRRTILLMELRLGDSPSSGMICNVCNISLSPGLRGGALALPGEDRMHDVAASEASLLSLCCSNRLLLFSASGLVCHEEAGEKPGRATDPDSGDETGSRSQAKVVLGSLGTARCRFRVLLDDDDDGPEKGSTASEALRCRLIAWTPRR